MMESCDLKTQLFWTRGHYEHSAFVAILVATILFPVPFQGSRCSMPILQMEKPRQRQAEKCVPEASRESRLA